MMGRTLAIPIYKALLCFVIEESIAILEKKFKKLKISFKDELNQNKIGEEKVVEELKKLKACKRGYYCQFQDGYLNELCQAADNSELIGMLNFSMDYLSYHLLDRLAETFNLECLKIQMEMYKSLLSIFLENTLLGMFCTVNCKKKRLRLPEFEEVVTTFEPPGSEEVTLDKVVTQFRREYCAYYELNEFSMIFAYGNPPCITWFVPKSVTKMLKEFPKKLLKRYFVTKLEVEGSFYSVEYKVSV